jgi:hypothetical protein
LTEPQAPYHDRQILDTPSDKALAFSLICLLKLDYEVDDFVIVEAAGDRWLTRHASNAFDSAPKAVCAKTDSPASAKCLLAVHRHENRLYFKRLEAEAMILTALGRGASQRMPAWKPLIERESEVNWLPSFRPGFRIGPSGWLCRAK